MPQLSDAIRLGVVASLLTEEDRRRAYEQTVAGKRGVITLPVENMEALTKLMIDAAREAGIDLTDDPPSPASIKSGLNRDFGNVFAGTAIVNIDGEEIDGNSWIKKTENSPKKEKVTLTNIVEKFDALKKDQQVRRGVEIQLPEELRGKGRGRQRTDGASLLFGFMNVEQPTKETTAARGKRNSK